MKVGDRVMVVLEVREIIEDSSGTRYDLGPVDGRGYSCLRIKREQIHSFMEEQS